MTHTSGNGQYYKTRVTNTLVRDLAIIKQLLDKKSRVNNKRAILETIKQIKLLQLDSINVVERSHYLVILSRIGLYDKRFLDELLFPDRALFEQWSHANCLIPTDFYPLFWPEILNRRNMPLRYGRLQRLGENPSETLNEVLQRVNFEGPLSSKDFVDNGNEKRKWWNRKPSRVALDVLWNQGYLAIQRRDKFHCYYDLAERIIPYTVFKEKHSLEEFRRWAIINSLDAQGIGTVTDINDYFRQKLPETESLLAQLVYEGVIVVIEIDGWDEYGYALSKDLKLIDMLKTGKHNFDRTTLLSPFDNLIWCRSRTERLFSFIFSVEMYIPKGKRVFGYFSMPILYRNQIIGMVDPKADRKKQVLIINMIRINKDVELHNDMVSELANALIEFRYFNNCKSIVIKQTSPKDLKTELECNW